MNKWWRPLSVLLACLLAFAGLRLLRAEGKVEAIPTQADIQERFGVPVEAARARKVPVQRSLRLYGTARGAQQTEIFIPTPNILSKLHVEVGQDVRRGQLLATMRPVATSPLGYPYQPLKIKKDTLEADLERYESLYAKGAITEQQIEHARAQAAAARADFEAASAAVQVTSPISGTVTRIDFHEGEWVPSAQPMMQVSKVDQLLVDFMAEPSDALLIDPGQEVTVSSPTLPGATFQGQVVERAMAAHPKLSQFRVRVRVENPDRTLLPGLPVRADILMGSPEPVLAVPLRALVDRDGKRGVWVVEDGDRAAFREVVLGPSNDTLQAVRSGLQEGDLVVTLGKDDVKRDGQALLVVEAE